MTAAFILAALVFFGHVHIWHILSLSFGTGLAQAFGGPAYQSLIPSLVHKKHLPNAIALNSIQFNLARVFGPLLAGVALFFGTAACFGLNGLSFLVVIVALMSLHIKHIRPADRKPMLQEMKGGLAYARSEPSIIALTVLAFLTTFLGTAAADVSAGLRARDLSRRSQRLHAHDGVFRRRRGDWRARRRLAGAVQAHGADAAHRAGAVRRAHRRLRDVAGRGGGAAVCCSWPARR